MDFVPHTPEDDAAMLEAIGLSSMDDLFEAVPAGLAFKGLLDVPEELSEVELLDHLGVMAARNGSADRLVCFAGGGAYDHHVPAAVRALASRGEFATSYTPYQPELSQGVLQAIFEFQTQICELFGLEVANASLYDGASSLVEAVNLSVRQTGREKVIISSAIHPHYVEVLKAYTSGLDLDVQVTGLNDTGVPDWEAIDASGSAALVWGYPNFFGRVEDGRTASDRAHAEGALSIVVADPTMLGVLESPGELGADVAAAEGYALGNHLSYGGPYVGMFATKLDLVRQVPGRICGETLDADGRRAYVLTLQAREQHIRRAKATSNVCTNQTLMAIAASIHMAWLGPVGLERLGEICIRRTAAAAARLGGIDGCRVRFTGPHGKEFVLETPIDGDQLARSLAARGYLVGPALGRWYPDMGNCLLIAMTERRTQDDLTGLAEAIEKELTER